MSFLFDWFYGMLSYLGLYHKNAKILFLGLDNAGKTTLLNKLKHGKISAHQPTTHPGFEEIQMGSVNFKAHDLGGHETARKLWTTYFPEVDAIVYLVDAVDKERFPEAKKELDALLATEGLASTPFVILGNKIDVPRAASEPELRGALGLLETTGKGVTSIPKDSGVRPIEIFMCSIVREQGYPDAFRWISNFVS